MVADHIYIIPTISSLVTYQPFKMPTEEEMRAHNKAHRSSREHRPFHPFNTFSAPSRSSIYSNPRPTLNIYANQRGDLMYEPDPRWSRRFSNIGYKVNLHEVRGVENIGKNNVQLFSQYAMHPNGELVVDGYSIPMLETDLRKVSVLKGYEHGRTYVPNSPDFLPVGEIRKKLGEEEPQENCVLSCVRAVRAVFFTCIASFRS